MAFSRTPAKDTYKTQQIRLVKELGNRGTSTSKDEDYINVFPEIIKNRTTKEEETYLVKRPGTAPFITTGASGAVRGMFFWETTNQVVVAIGTGLYRYNAATGALVSAAPTQFSTSTGHVGFTEFLLDTGDILLVVTDGTTLLTITTGGTVNTTTTGLPVPHQPYPVFLDGFLFLLKTNTADIFNSNLNDPMTWTSTDYLTAEALPDDSLILARLSNYVVCLGPQSIEYFWNAANPTDSPLSRNPTPLKMTGVLSNVAHLGNKMFMIGNHNDSQPDIFILEDFKITPIGNEAIRRHLASLSLTSLTSVHTNILSVNGQDFYVFYSPTATYCYELSTKLWTRLEYGLTGLFPVTHIINGNSSAGYQTFWCASGSTLIYKFDSGLYQDNGGGFPAQVVTDIEEFNTYNQKTMARLILWADKTPTTAPVLVQWTDDDYQSYNAGISLDLVDELPCVRRLGRFRRRAFKLTYTGNLPIRFKSLEVEINMGQH
jgi:hypothetical protein